MLLIWAFGLSGRAAYMGFCPFRACSLYGLLGLKGDAVMGFWALLLIWAFGPSGRCSLYGLLGLQGDAVMGFWALLLIWASAPLGRCSLYGLLGLQGDAVMGFWALLLIWAFGPSGRCCPMQISQNFRAVWLKLPSTPFCMVEITQHALLYG